jgi:hypothetical protein
VKTTDGSASTPTSRKTGSSSKGWSKCNHIMSLFNGRKCCICPRCGITKWRSVKAKTPMCWLSTTGLIWNTHRTSPFMKLAEVLEILRDYNVFKVIK